MLQLAELDEVPTSAPGAIYTPPPVQLTPAESQALQETLARRPAGDPDSLQL